MKVKMVGSIPELMANVGFSGAVDFLIRQNGDYLLGEVLQIEAQATWFKMWITKPPIKDTNISPEDEKKLWENFELMKKGLREGAC